MTPALVVPVLGRKLYPGASVALDFTRNLYRSGTPVVKASPSLLSGWTFARASTGYAETAAGALVAFASGAPRITDKGLLAEEARTNLLLRSQEFDNASWGKNTVSATANTGLAPDGTTTRDTVTVSTSGGSRSIYQAVTPAAVVQTFSVYLYAGTVSSLDMGLYQGGFLTIAATVLSGPGVVGGAAPTTRPTISNLSATVPTRVAITTAAAVAASSLEVYIYPYGVLSQTAGDSVGLWGAQLEAGSFPTSYIPTTTASATRAADVATLAYVPVSPGTVVARGAANTITTSVNAFVSLNDGTANNEVKLYEYPSFVGLNVRVGAADQCDISGGSAASGVPVTAAGRWGTNDFAISRGGAAVVTDVSGSIPAMTQINFGRQPAGSILNGYLQRAIIYPYAFTDAQLVAATA